MTREREKSTTTFVFLLASERRTHNYTFMRRHNHKANNGRRIDKLILDGTLNSFLED